jgi:C_GCAxxG_C_C family probable redox protein
MEKYLSSPPPRRTIDLEKIKLTAQEYYASGDFYCSEAVVKTIKDAFGLPVSEEVIAAASGFAGGMGKAGCVCGAVAGGVICLGLVFGRTAPGDRKVDKAMKLSRELHDHFKKRHKCLCCRTLNRYVLMGSASQREQCVAFTGEMAQETAAIIIREQEKMTTAEQLSAGSGW